MRKLLVAVCLVSMVFATTAIAAETYTEKFVQSKTQKIVDAEKKARAQQAENEKKAKAAREAQAKKQAEAKAKVEAEKARLKKEQQAREDKCNKRVITSSGLIKNEYRNEKDDRNKNTNKILSTEFLWTTSK